MCEFMHLLVEGDAEVALADGGICDMHKVRPRQRIRLVAPAHTPALRDAEGLGVPGGIGASQALSNAVEGYQHHVCIPSLGVVARETRSSCTISHQLFSFTVHWRHQATLTAMVACYSQCFSSKPLDRAGSCTTAEPTLPRKV